MRIRFTVVVALAAAVLAVPAAAETIESAEQAISALWEKVDTFTGAMEMRGSAERGGVAFKQAGTGTVETMKKGDTMLFRTNLTMKMDMGGQTMEQKMLSVFDGEYVYTQMDMMGTPMVMRMKPDVNSAMTVGSGKAMFAELRKVYDLELLPDETVDDEPAYVFQMTMKENAEAPHQTAKKMKMYFSKKTGLQRKMVVFDEADKPIMTNTFKDIVLNPTIAPERFKYAAPPGAQIMDMGNMGSMGQPGQ